MADSNTLVFEIDGHKFEARKLNAKQQFHLSRRLAPLLPSIGRLLISRGTEGAGLLAALSAKEGEEHEPTMMDLAQLLDLAEPVAQAIGSMKDEDADKIFELALCSVKVQTNTMPEAWMPLWIPNAGMTPLPELNDFAALVPVLLKVVGFNLGNFTKGLLTRREDPKAQSPSGAPFPAARIG